MEDLRWKILRFWIWGGEASEDLQLQLYICCEYLYLFPLAMDRSVMKERTKAMTVRVLRLLDALPHSPKGQVIANQLGRSASSVGANYRAACRARSTAEFIAKIGITLEEADETEFWLEVIIEAGILRERRVKPLLIEAGELVSIFAATRITAQKNQAQRTGKEKAAPAASSPNKYSAPRPQVRPSKNLKS